MKEFKAFKKSGNFCFSNWNCPYCMKLRGLVNSLIFDKYDKYIPYKSKKFEIT